MNDSALRILIIDRQAIVLAGVRLLLEKQSSFCIVGEATNPADAIDIAGREQPDIIVLEPNFGAQPSLDLIPSLLQVARSARVLILSDLADSELLAQAVRLGARGVVLKTDSPAMLSKAVTKIGAGEVWFDRRTTAELLSHFSGQPYKEEPDADSRKIASLTDREIEVTALIGQGLKNKQIAERLSISEVTVRHHLTSIFSKLGISDRLELLLYAYQQGLAKPPPSASEKRSR